MEETYKYENIIIDNKLHFSLPNSFNDPFDCRVVFNLNGVGNEWYKRFIKLIQKYKPNMRMNKIRKIATKWATEKRYIYLKEEMAKGDANAIRDTFGVLCLTKKSDCIPMWANYASHHKGICVEFNHDKSDKLFGMAMKVIYKKAYPVYRYLDVKVKDIIVDLLNTKHMDWSYEEEWRVYAHPGIDYNGPGLHPFNPSTLVGIIFGCNATDDFKKYIKSLMAKREGSVSLYQAEENKNGFGLSKRLIH